MVVRSSAAAAAAAAAAVLVAGGGSAATARDPKLAAALAFVKAHCRKGAPVPAADVWNSYARFNALEGDCGGGDGRDQHVWFFLGRRFVGLDAPTSSHEVNGEWRDEWTLAFMYVLFRQTDASCCPTGGGRIVRYRWNGNRVVRLDPLPPRAFTGRGPGR
jgi:hypothetical protein